MHAEALEHQRSQEFRLRMAERRAGKKTRPPDLPPLPAPEVAGETILVVGDGHCHPDHPNQRFDLLGRLITDLQPDAVVDMGDWWDMPSLSSYELPGSKTFEGKRYWLDIEAGIDAQERVEAQLADWNRGRRQKVAPRFVRCLGNHEERIGRVLEAEPRWSEMIGTHDLMSEEFGWEEHPHGEIVELGGVAFCHSFPSGIMGRPISGEHPAKMLIVKQHMSCVAGHSHTKDYAERNDAMGRRIQSVFVGCFFDFDLAWTTKRVNQMYSRGLLVLRDVRGGTYDFEWLSMDALRRKYA